MELALAVAGYQIRHIKLDHHSPDLPNSQTVPQPVFNIKVALQEGVQLGRGGFSCVYEARELHTGRAVALKKSRVSLRIRRSLLQHEARVLKLLSGHPTIPEVYGYCRIAHFELISMQLLGSNLGDVLSDVGSLPVAVVIDLGDQLLSALEHIHTKGIVHRDIKPSNILLRTPGRWEICLADFGLAYSAPRELLVTSHLSDHSELSGVFGTLPYSSLNAHEELTYRDDLESLSYTLLCFLRGKLSWSDYANHGTIYGRIRQVHAQKRRYNGTKLAAGLPDVFGTLVDFARSLGAQKIPDYRNWRNRLSQVDGMVSQDIACDRIQSKPDVQASGSRLFPPVESGQVALVRLIPSITAEGYSVRVGHEDSYICNPGFNAPEWDSPARPCIIFGVEWDDKTNSYRFTAVPISVRQAESKENNYPGVPIVHSESCAPHSTQATISIKPDWPLQRSYCYAFKRPTTFSCLPSQPIVPGTWSVDAEGIETIVRSLTPPRRQFGTMYDSESPDPDVRHDANMRTGYVKLYAEVSPLTPAHMSDPSIDWNSTRGWFDECVKAARYYDLCSGNEWTQKLDKIEDVSNSYRGLDFEEWEPQRERDQSLTLAPILENDGRGVLNVLEGLDEIELSGQLS